jgi:hypothetical protein
MIFQSLKIYNILLAIKLQSEHMFYPGRTEIVVKMEHVFI